MIECIFTLDYEIYGNGTGSLREHVYEPAKQLHDIFVEWKARFVNFVEVAEFRKIEEVGSDAAIELVKGQIYEFHKEGFETALHLHPQWWNGHYTNGQWHLDSNEYNLCVLPTPRITEIVCGSLKYLEYVTRQTSFTPLSFRAGNWLFQPTTRVANVLADRGIRLDSSVFKGGLQHTFGLDYRPALRNGFYWTFSSDVNIPDPKGNWTEVPIHSEMVFPWKLATSKRLSFSNGNGTAGRRARHKVNRALDLLRLRYPVKLDFCRMTLIELTTMMERVIRQDRRCPDLYTPIVAIGHTKDLTDPRTVGEFLAFLHQNKIPVSTFNEAYPKLQGCKLAPSSCC